MNRKGFTLTELLVVIAIIGILSVIIVPSVIKINSNINERLLRQKNDYIKSAAEMYASNNPDLFNGTDVNYVYVHQLIANNYLEYDEELHGKNCKETLNEKAAGCLINPTDKTSMNDIQVKIEKKNVGIVAEIISGDVETIVAEPLIKKVCDGFNNSYQGFTYDSNGNKISCECNTSYDDLTDGEYCVLAPKDGSKTLDNWLKYGNENWRVVGIYKESGKLYAKIITNDIISE